MRKTILSVLFLSNLLVNAAEPTDSTEVKTLEGVEVVGENQRATLKGAEYIPTKKLKEMSDGGMELLRLMQLPQIKMLNGQFGEEQFTTTDGTPITYFVNGRPASEQQIRMLLAKNTLKIEFLDHPSDPIYRGAPYVLNFVMKTYVYGGYTKLSAREGFNDHMNVFSGSVYSKFSYKRMTYDLLFSPQLSRFGHTGDEDREAYRVKDADGNEREEWRTTSYLKGNNANNQFPVGFRAFYTDNNKYIDNSIGFSHSGNPGSSKKSLLSFSNPLLGEDNISENWNHNYNNSVGWTGQYMWQLPKAWTIVTDPGITYSHSRANQRYTSSVEGFQPVENNSVENIYNYYLDVFLGKSFRPTDYFNVGLIGSYTDSHIEYYGSRQQKERLGQMNASLTSNYQFVVKQKFRFGVGLNIGINSTRLYGKTDTKFTPRAAINAVYNPNNKNSFSLKVSFLRGAKPAYMLSSVVNRVNEFLYSTGNDNITGPKNLNLSLDYNLFASNSFNMNLYGNYAGDYDRTVYYYEPYLDGRAVLRTFLNSGDFNKLNFGGNFTFKFIDGNLSLQLSPQMSYSHSSGIYRYSLLNVNGTVSASYMIRRVALSLWVQTPRTAIDSTMPLKQKYGWSATLNASWNYRNLNMGVEIDSPWRTNYSIGHSELDTPYYYSYSKGMTPLWNWDVTFRLSYTFDYGKKIDRGNELHQMNLRKSSTLM